MTDTEDPSEPRRRDVSPATRASRDASRLVRPINEKIGPWQAESIRLATAADRIRQSGREDAEIVAAINELIRLVEGEQQAFARELLQAPAGVAEHSRVGDTKRALDMVIDRLRAALRA